MCPECTGTSKHYHWLTFRSITDLEGHLRLLTHRDDQIQSIVGWWTDTVALYHGTVSPITGAPLTVAEAWRDAQLLTTPTPVSDRTAAAEARVQALVDDPSLSDREVMQRALGVVDRLLDHMPSMPTDLPKRTTAEVAAYIAQEGR